MLEIKIFIIYIVYDGIDNNKKENTNKNDKVL
jgi:hypothetical protein